VGATPLTGQPFPPYGEPERMTENESEPNGFSLNVPTVRIRGGRLLRTVQEPQEGTEGTNGEEEDMKITWKGILFWLLVAFFVVYIWTDPTGAGSSVGPFLADVGHFVVTFFEKTAAFLSGL
jgi:hypothetical protein